MKPVNVSYGPGGVVNACVSSQVRAVFDIFKPIQRDISFDTVFDISRIDSNPVRSVRMQWSNICLMVPTTPPSGLVNVPDGS